MEYIDYLLKQRGKDLIGEKIIIEHLDNYISRFVFDFDGTIPGRIYLALNNPVTKKHIFFPVTKNTVIIGTSVSLFVGRWTALILGVASDYELTNDIGNIGNLDKTKITYVSKEFKRIIVRKNFLSNETQCVSYPPIDHALDSFNEARDRLEEMSIIAAEDADKCNEKLQSIMQLYDEIVEMRNECRRMLNETKEQ